MCASGVFTNWAIAILPYMELQSLYDQYHQNLTNLDPANKTVRETLVPAYCCPSEVDATIIATPATGPGVTPSSVNYRRGSYHCSSGYVAVPIPLVNTRIKPAPQRAPRSTEVSCIPSATPRVPRSCGRTGRPKPWPRLPTGRRTR